MLNISLMVGKLPRKITQMNEQKTSNCPVHFLPRKILPFLLLSFKIDLFEMNNGNL